MALIPVYRPPQSVAKPFNRTDRLLGISPWADRSLIYHLKSCNQGTVSVKRVWTKLQGQDLFLFLSFSSWFDALSSLTDIWTKSRLVSKLRMCLGVWHHITLWQKLSLGQLFPVWFHSDKQAVCVFSCGTNVDLIVAQDPGLIELNDYSSTSCLLKTWLSLAEGRSRFLSNSCW